MDFEDRNFKMAALKSKAARAAENAAERAAALDELGLCDQAQADDIRNAFRARVKASHPDVPGGNEVRLRRLILARDLLVSDMKRPVQSFVSKETCDNRSLPHGSAISLEISLNQALFGGKIHTEVPALDIAAPHEVLTSLTQMRSVSVTLPKGLREGEKVKLKIEGPTQGEHFFRITLDSRPECRVWGDDIWMTAEIEPRLLQTGGRAMIETPHGPQNIQIDKDIPRGASLCLFGKGLPATETCPAGNLYIRIEAAQESERDGVQALNDFRSRWAS